MGKTVKHVEGRTKEDRVRIRQTLGPLRDLTVQPKTKQRYENARNRFYTFLRDSHLSLPSRREALDGLLCDYLELLWSTGEGRGLASDTVAGLQDRDPRLRGQLLGSWRLLKAWNMQEIPNRAPPFPESVLQVMVGWAIFKEEPLFALSLLIGFYGLLRTGELYDLHRQSISMESGHKVAVIALGLTKGGKRTGAAESTTLNVAEVLRRLWQWRNSPSLSSKLVSSIYKWRQLFHQCLESLGIHDMGFRPYSLRRGGATFWFQRHGSFDKLLVQGRWQSSKTARVYLNEGLALLAELKIPQSQLNPFLRIYLRASKDPLPQLELPSKGGSSGGRGRKSKATKRSGVTHVHIPKGGNVHS